MASGEGNRSESQQQLDEHLVIVDIRPTAVFGIHDIFKFHEDITGDLQESAYRQGLAIPGARQARILEGRAA